MANVFLSYRRDDSEDVAGRIYDRLVDDFGASSVYRDVDTVPLGVDFSKHIKDAVEECDALLAVIGPEWLTVTTESGQRRLDDPADFVRMEIESALNREIPVIPLLVRKATIPTDKSLPESLQKLALRNGISVRADPDFHSDLDRLIISLKEHLQNIKLPTDLQDTNTGQSTQKEPKTQSVHQHLNAALAGRYIVEDVIGEGSIGTVYRARNANIDQTVALKVLRSDLASEVSFVKRFEMESRVSAQLSHPNIISVLDCGTINNVSYIALKYIEGPSLADVLKRGGFDKFSALQIARALAAALDYAHGHGILHRDVKPSNVLIPELHGQLNFEEAVLSDFGHGAEVSRPSGQTQTGMLIGTPYYMSPEQIRGGSHSAASDIFGFGVLMYEMLYGRRPFTGPSSLELVNSQLNAQVSFPNDPSISKDLKQLIEACLQKDPSMRPVLLLPAIDKIEVGEPTTSDRKKPQNVPNVKEERFLDRSTSTVVIGVAFAILLVAWIGLVLTGMVGKSLDLLVGSAFVVGGGLVGYGVHQLLIKRRGNLERETNRILTGAKTRVNLTASLAVEVSAIMDRCQTLDQRFLGKTLWIMVGEYETAETFDDRQKALVTAVRFLDKLMNRLSPWYIKYKKPVAVLVALVGIVPGVIMIVEAVAG